MKRTSMKLCVAALWCGVAAVLTATQAQAQGLAQGLAAPNLAGSVWFGSEDLNGAPGVLGFGFNASGEVGMLDRSTKNPSDPTSLVRGTWYQNGSEIEIRFGNCIYRGRIT